MGRDAVLNIVIKAIDNASGVATSVGGAFEKSASVIEAAGKKTAQTGKTMTKGLTLPIIGAGVAAIKLSTDFNASMANIATLIPGNTERVNELKTGIQDLAIQTGKSTADMSDGAYQVISAFGDTNDTIKILETNAKAAAAGLAETTDAINLTSAVTKGYGDVSSDAVTKASDLALMTVRLGQTTFPELAASIGRVTPLAASLNVTQEELFGTMATFTGVTGGAAEVSTQLRGVLQALMAPTDSMTKLMKKMGYENGQAMIKGEGLQKTINAITAEAKATDKPLQDYMGSIEGQTLALAAAGGQSDVYKEKIAAMSGVVGTTDQAFNEVTQGVNASGFSMAQATQKVQVLSQKIGDQLAPFVVKLADKVTNLTDRFSRLTPQQQKTVLAIAAVVAAVGPALIIIGKMAVGLSAIMSAATKVSTALHLTARAQWVLNAAMSANPIILVVGALASLIGILASFKIGQDNAGSSSDKFKSAQDRVKASTDALKFAEQSLTDARLAREGSDIAVQRAEERLNELKQSGTASALDLREAEYNLAVAKEAAKTAADNEKTAIEANSVAKSENKAATEALEAANARLSSSAWGSYNAYANLTEQINAASKAQREGDFAGSANAQLGLPTNWSPGLVGRSAGGPVKANQPYLVGENPDGSINRTTELMVPKSAGSIISSSDLQKALRNAGGGRSTTIGNLNVYPQTAEAVREIFRQLDNDTILANTGLTPVRGGN